MNFKNLIKSNFTYQPEKTYNFTLGENSSSQNMYDLKKSIPSPELVFESFADNLKYIQSKYNTLINSDVIVRKFILQAKSNQFNAFVVCIDGMVNSDSMDNFVIKPLMMRNPSNQYTGNTNKIVSAKPSNNITINKSSNFSLDKYILNSLLPQNSVTTTSSFSDIFTRHQFWKLRIIYRHFKMCF